MIRYRKALLLAPLLLLTVSIGAPAKACEDLRFYPVDQHIETALAVVHARVTQTKVVRLSDLAIASEAAVESDRSKIVKVRLQVLEEFKNAAGEIDAIYTPYIPDGVISCDMEPFPGEEYVLFLHRESGILRRRQPSFVVVSRYIPDDVLEALGVPERLQALRRWKSAQQN